ncbi:sigma-54-dependent Fis family transcriptional regulator [candidate division KSB1 bacterium]|nr:MAG: sigma-54-dependent Fis family transcriptional regulator [candidate division KSB1 bacterium]MBC6948658.1 sigma-54-dependent Fis family transcriptional regulator [candidate division KSB1 bacterium]MCE7944336.1 sigma-54-dependent Fis family transcriptional regulator [Chlorobi bacterium CHB1]MDL1876693.1 sigma-54-dependent Fis family transcriptional regulator [Cytophagia bacterium CHB2]
MNSNSEKHTLLIIDDQPQFAQDFILLTGEEFNVVTAANGEDGLRKFQEVAADLILVDLKLGRGIDGIETLRRLKQADPDAGVIIVTEHASIETAHQAGRLGALDYCSKAPNLKELRAHLKQHLQNVAWRRAYRDELQRQYPKFIAESPAMRKLIEDIDAVAPSDRLVLITGESGAGKELVAREIHRRSLRAERPLFVVNCSNLAAPLFESEFFGHERGSFTSADRQQRGKFEAAHLSTLFLDEVGDLPLESQPKILRAVEYGKFNRIGKTHEQHADVRLIAATNHNLEEETKAGRFRQDLFYRINRVNIHVPPLRQRREDIPPLINYYLEYFSLMLHRLPPEIPADVMQDWLQYDWPGNVRELTSAIENLVLFSKDGKIDRSRLSLPPRKNTSPELFLPLFDLPYEQAKEKLIDQFQQDYFHEKLRRHEGNYTRAAEEAGVNRATIYRILASGD